ncbi:retinaldehyde-binding protein 1 isoform X2 [Rhipicephalus microplus]|uniref:retinaldehyde-binding protein 1 isoform X2 n=1 Tax=Rhipicephalus microplus TaxID=6941 RepID=UPI003F6B8ED1
MMDLQERARLELGETQEVREECLRRLRLLIKEASLHVPSDEKFLLMFLRSKKYNVEAAFRVFQNYVNARRDVPEFFRDLRPENSRLREICHENHLVMTSTEPDSLGRSMALMRLGAWNPTMCSFNDFIRGVLTLASCNFYEDLAQIGGVAGIVDLEGLGFHHFRQLTPGLLIKMTHITQVHFVREDLSELWKICPQDLVPDEFGGKRNDFDFDRQEELVFRKRHVFEDLCRYDLPPP